MTTSRTWAARRGLLTAGAATLLTSVLPAAFAQSRVLLRISTPAVPDDWHAKMWTVFKDTLDKSAPGEFDVQINLNASLFKQGAEPAAMARGNLELTTISAFDIAKLVPEFSVFTAGYMVRDPAHQQKVFNGPIGTEMFKTVAENEMPTRSHSRRPSRCRRAAPLSVLGTGGSPASCRRAPRPIS